VGFDNHLQSRVKHVLLDASLRISFSCCHTDAFTTTTWGMQCHKVMVLSIGLRKTSENLQLVVVVVIAWNILLETLSLSHLRNDLANQGGRVKRRTTG